MTERRRIVSASTFREWYECLEEIVAQDQNEVATGNARSAVSLLHDLVGVGLRNDMVRLVVSRSSGPRGFSHLSFRYPLHETFDGSRGVAFTWEPDDQTRWPEQLIAEIEAATGVTAEDDASAGNEE
jgi:hypothetical protein